MTVLDHDAGTIPPPTDSQAHLEGLVIGSLRHLLRPERPFMAPGEGFVPRMIALGADHYTIAVDGSGLPSALCQLLPVWELGAEAIETGIPGLRYRDHDNGAGVSFYLPRRAGRFTFLGPSIRALETYRRVTLAHAGLRSVGSDDPLLPVEAASPIRTPGSVAAASVVGRTLGMLLDSSPSAIDTWWSAPGRLSVELAIANDAPDPIPRLIERMLAARLSPRLRLDTVRSDHRNHSYLTLNGSDAEIDLRVLWVPTS